MSNIILCKVEWVIDWDTRIWNLLMAVSVTSVWVIDG